MTASYKTQIMLLMVLGLPDCYNASDSKTSKCNPGIKVEYFKDENCNGLHEKKHSIIYKKKNMHKLNACQEYSGSNPKKYFKTHCDVKGYNQ